MAYALNEKLLGLKPYETVAGDFPIRLDANESFQTLPPAVMEAVNTALLKVDYNRYPDPNATAVCEAFARYYDISPDLVMAGNGSDELIYLITTAFLMKGDKILVLSPDFSMYSFYAALAEAPTLVMQKGPEYTVDVEKIIRIASEEKVKLIVFSNPCNPTAQGIPREEVDRLIRAVDALVVLDEAYMDFWDQSLLPDVTDYENLIILRTMSKAIGMAAIRLGFAVSTKSIRQTLLAVKSPYNANSITQVIGETVLNHGDELRKLCDGILVSRDRLYTECKRLAEEYPEMLSVYPSHTNFLTMPTAHAQTIYEKLKEKGILIRSFPRFLRVTCGTEAENEAFLAALREILSAMSA